VHTTAVHVEAMPKAAAKVRTVHARAEKPRTAGTEHARAEKPRTAGTEHARAEKPRTPATVHARAERPRTPARTKLVRRHSNPLDANASDTRIQVWPCRSGGICNWQRSAQ